MPKKYTKEHEWIEPVSEGHYRIGLTNFAQEQLGDVVTVELPEIGAKVIAGEECAAVESVKAASDIFSPATGTVTNLNDSLEENPELVNESPNSKGWLWEMRLDDESELEGMMNEKDYDEFVGESQ